MHNGSPSTGDDELTTEELEILKALRLKEIDRDIKVCNAWLVTVPFNEKGLRNLARLSEERRQILENDPIGEVAHG